MDFCVISVGKISSPWIEQGIKIFQERIIRYVKYSEIIIPDIKNAKSINKEILKEEEGKAILDNVQSSDFVVLMDEKGIELTSRKFSEWIQKQMLSGKKRLVFIVGGPYGFSEKVYNRADGKIALSLMTFTHEMAKLILTEQIYRSLTILKGEPYHHD